MSDCLDGKENIAGADGIAFAEILCRLLGGFFQSALRRKVVVGVGFGADFGKLGALDKALDGA